GPSTAGEVVAEDDEQEVSKVVGNLPGRLERQRSQGRREDQEREQGPDTAGRQAQGVEALPGDDGLRSRGLGFRTHRLPISIVSRCRVESRYGPPSRLCHEGGKSS